MAVSQFSWWHSLPTSFGFRWIVCRFETVYPFLAWSIFALPSWLLVRAILAPIFRKSAQKVLWKAVSPLEWLGQAVCCLLGCWSLWHSTWHVTNLASLNQVSAFPVSILLHRSLHSRYRSLLSSWSRLRFLLTCASQKVFSILRRKTTHAQLLRASATCQLYQTNPLQVLQTCDHGCFIFGLREIQLVASANASVHPIQVFTYAQLPVGLHRLHSQSPDHQHLHTRQTLLFGLLHRQSDSLLCPHSIAWMTNSSPFLASHFALVAFTLTIQVSMRLIWALNSVFPFWLVV